jgi:hypothetical protein
MNASPPWRFDQLNRMLDAIERDGVLYQPKRAVISGTIRACRRPGWHLGCGAWR